MDKIAKRAFELSTSNGITVIVCTASFNKNECNKCIKDFNESDLSKNYSYVKFFEYDVSTDEEKWETYNIIDTPKILIFDNNKLIYNFVYDNINHVNKCLKEIYPL